MDCCASLGEDVTKFFLLLHQALRHKLVLQTVWKKILMIAKVRFCGCARLSKNKQTKTNMNNPITEKLLCLKNNDGSVRI